MVQKSKALSSVASPRSQTSVFISHAGEQKKGFVDVLYHALTEEGISVFVDEHSLVPGTPEAWESIIEALTAAAVGVARCADTQVAYDPLCCPAHCPAQRFQLFLVQSERGALHGLHFPSAQGNGRHVWQSSQWWWCCRRSLCARSIQ